MPILETWEELTHLSFHLSTKRCLVALECQNANWAVLKFGDLIVELFEHISGKKNLFSAVFLRDIHPDPSLSTSTMTQIILWKMEAGHTVLVHKPGVWREKEGPGERGAPWGE